MTNRSFLIRAGISLAILSALPLFASAMGLNHEAEPVVATEAYSRSAMRALETADAESGSADRTGAPASQTHALQATANQTEGLRAPADQAGPVQDATFTGAYSGTGQAADFSGWASDCASATITIADSASDVKLSNQKYGCGSLGATHDPIQLLKKADGLYLGDKKVGLYSSTEIDAMVPFEHLNGTSFVFRLIKRGDSLVYTEDWLSQQDGALDQIFEMGSTLKPTAPALLR